MGWFNTEMNQKCPKCGCHVEEKVWSGGGCIDAILMSIITAIVSTQAKCPICRAKYPKRPRAKPSIPPDTARKRVLCAAPRWLRAILFPPKYGVEPVACDTVDDLVATIKGQTPSSDSPPTGQVTFDAVLIALDAPGMPIASATALLRQHGYHEPVIAISDHPMPKKEQDEVGCKDYVCTSPTFAPDFLWEILAHAIADHRRGDSK